MIGGTLERHDSQCSRHEAARDEARITVLRIASPALLLTFERLCEGVRYACAPIHSIRGVTQPLLE